MSLTRNAPASSGRLLGPVASESSGSPRDDHAAGVRNMVAGAAGFSLMSLFVKLLGDRLPTQEVVLARSLFGLLLTLALLRRARVAPLGQRRGLLLVRGILGTGGLVCFFYAVMNLPLAEATVLHYLNPVLTAVFAAVFLGERAGRNLIVSLLLSSFGVLVLTRPAALFGGAPSELPPLAVGIAILGAVFAAGAYTSVRSLSRSEDPLVIVMWFPLVAVPLVTPAVVPSFVMPQGTDWLLLLAMGVFTQVGQVGLTRGLKFLPAGRAMALSYLQIVFAAVLGVVAFGEVPNAWTLAGAGLVLTGAWLAKRG